MKQTEVNYMMDTAIITLQMAEQNSRGIDPSNKDIYIDCVVEELIKYMKEYEDYIDALEGKYNG